VASRGLTEQGIYQMNLAFVQALRGAHVPFTANFYGAGTHDWPYWQDDLRAFLGFLATARSFAPPGFSYRSAESAFSVWDWQFTTHRLVDEFCYLDNVSKSGLDVRGSGQLDVVTARLYPPHSAHRVNGVLVRADDTGRLRFSIDLGP
jgi:hypothetical protein